MKDVSWTLFYNFYYERKLVKVTKTFWNKMKHVYNIVELNLRQSTLHFYYKGPRTAMIKIWRSLVYCLFSVTCHIQWNGWICESPRRDLIEDNFVSCFSVVDPIPYHSNRWSFTRTYKNIIVLDLNGSSTSNTIAEVVLPSIATTSNKWKLKSCTLKFSNIFLICLRITW